jgi:hypothetical protein
LCAFVCEYEFFCFLQAFIKDTPERKTWSERTFGNLREVTLERNHEIDKGTEDVFLICKAILANCLLKFVVAFCLLSGMFFFISTRINGQHCSKNMNLDHFECVIFANQCAITVHAHPEKKNGFLVTTTLDQVSDFFWDTNNF